MTIRQSIRAGLETALSAVAGLPAAQYRSWENVAFTVPAPTVAWVEATFSPGRTRAITVGTAPTYQHEGLFLIDLHYPHGNGPALADAAADAIIAAFPVTADLVHTGVTTRIRYAERQAGARENAWFKVPIMVAWRTFSTTP